MDVGIEEPPSCSEKPSVETDPLLRAEQVREGAPSAPPTDLGGEWRGGDPDVAGGRKGGGEECSRWRRLGEEIGESMPRMVGRCLSREGSGPVQGLSGSAREPSTSLERRAEVFIWK